MPYLEFFHRRSRCTLVDLRSLPCFCRAPDSQAHLPPGPPPPPSKPDPTPPSPRPQASKILHAIDEMPPPRRWTLRTLIVGATCAVFAVYYKNIYVLPKIEYNKVRYPIAS